MQTAEDWGRVVPVIAPVKDETRSKDGTEMLDLIIALMTVYTPTDRMDLPSVQQQLISAKGSGGLFFVDIYF